MIEPATPVNEAARLHALRSLNILDTAAEERFDRYTRLAQQILQTPIVLISLIDDKRQWFKSRQGLDATETPRDISFCGHAILGDDLFYVHDATADPRFADNPLVIGAPDIRFYAGSPLTLDGGERIGTLCAIDRVPRDLTEGQRSALVDLARCVVDELQIQTTRAMLAEKSKELDAITERLHLMVEFVPIAMIMVNAEGSITLVNKETEKVFGYARDELVGRPVEMLVPERYRPVHQKHRNVFFTDPSVRTMGCGRSLGVGRDLFGLSKDGLEFPAEIGLSHLTVNDKKFVLASVIDITKRKSTEIDLARFSAIIKSSEDAIISKTLDGIITSWNESAKKLFGYTEQEMIGSSLIRLIPPDRLNEEAEILSRLRAGNQIKHFETVRVRKDGSFVDVLASISPIKDTSGKVIGISKIVHDNSERKRAERQLQEKSTLLALGAEIGKILIAEKDLPKLLTLCAETLVKHLQVAFARIWTLNGEEQVLELAASAGMYNHLNDEHAIVPVGKYTVGLIAQERLPHWTNDVQNDPKVSDKEWARREGMIAFAGFPLSVAGSLVGVMALSSRQPLSDPAIDTLAAVAKQLSLGIKKIQADAELILAKERTEAATLAKSDFLANMSHEIRTPMNAILGMLYLAMKTEMSPTLENYLSKAKGAANSLLGIINDILDFSKIEAGKLAIESVEFGLDTVLEQLTDVIGFQAEKKGLEFLISYDKDIPPRLIGDPLRLGQVLLNLCSNAVKFTEMGEVVLVLSGLNISETDLTLQISVRDTGIGMTPEVQNNLFQKFNQADQSITRRFGGTGLGLAISRLLIELMGGRIWVETSRPGQGTTVCCMVPCKIARQARAHQDELMEEAGPLLKGIRVLVVDDKSIAREILAEMLSSFQLDVETAASGETAINLIKEASGKPFDVVLMDWRMPGMNGDEATRRIRADQTIQPQPKVVIVTAHGREEVIKLAEQAGGDGFLIKPISSSTLLDTILSVLGRSRIFGLDKKNSVTSISSVLSGLAGAHLLLVEDNEINREFAVNLLHNMQVKVDEAMHGEEAVTMVQQYSYDAVLMDIQMPVMDGLEATRRIRALAQHPGNERFSSLPIIAMTAMAMAEDTEKCLQTGMNDFVTKPVDPDRFFAILVKWLKEKNDVAGTIPATTTTIPEAVVPGISAELLVLKNFDAVQGIRRIGGNPDAYRKQLRRFREHYHNAVDKLQRLITEKGIPAGKDFCHALKGVTGNLCAQELFLCVTSLDEHLKLGTVPGAEQFDRMHHLLQQTMTEIDWLATSEIVPKSATAELKRDELQAKLLVALASLLKNDLGAAELLLRELRYGVVGTEAEQAVNEIAANMDVFAIDEALDRIKKLSMHLSKTT